MGRNEILFTSILMPSSFQLIEKTRSLDEKLKKEIVASKKRYLWVGN